MSNDHAARLAALEQLDEDLFDFPDVEGMADLLAASRAAVAGGASVASPAKATTQGKTRAVNAVARDPKAPLPSGKASAPTSAHRTSAAPRNAEDLDDDLFGFGELFELGAAGDLGPTGSPQVPRPDADRTGDAQAPKAPRKGPLASVSAPDAAPMGAGSAPDKAREPRAGARERETIDATSTRTRDVGTGVAEPAPSKKRANAAAGRDSAGHAAAGNSSPFLPFPTSIDLPPARSKLLWVLVGCFLLANGGVFLMTQQQNQNVNATLMAVTSTLADAVARGSNAAPRETPTYRELVARDVEQPRASAPMLDPSDYSNTNELGLHNARRLIEQGAYAEARRNLFFILANQDRSTPLTPTLREDIDYLIALTYYDQGRSIAVEEGR